MTIRVWSLAIGSNILGFTTAHILKESGALDTGGFNAIGFWLALGLYFLGYALMDEGER